MSRQIDSVHDLSEDDVTHVYETLELVRGLADYADEREEHRGTFRRQFLASMESDVGQLWQQLAVIVAQRREEAIDPADLMEEMIDD